MSIPSWTSPRASAMTLPISRLIAWESRSLFWAMSSARRYMISPRFGAGVRRQSGNAVSAARVAIATSAAVPCWNRPMTSRVSAGLTLSKVRPLVDSHHSPAMKRRNVDGVAFDSARASSAVVVTSVQALERGRDGAATAEAQRRQAIAALAPVEFVEECRHDAGPARPDRVAQGDRAAVHVDLVPVETELPAVGEDLRGEGLVDLDEIER